MPVKNPTIEEKLTSGRIAIENSLNDTEILDMVSVFGYTTEKLTGGKTLLETADNLYLKQKNEYGEKYAASDELQTKWNQAHKAFMVQLGVARVALKSENSTVIKLGLNERRKVTLAAWLLQTNNFYTNVLADESIKAKLAAFSITEEKLTAVKKTG